MVFLTMVLHRLSLPFIVSTCTPEEWTSSLDPCSPKDWVRFRMDIIPEGPKKLPVAAKSMTAERTSTTGLCNSQDEVREKLDMAPE